VNTSMYIACVSVVGLITLSAINIVWAFGKLDTEQQRQQFKSVAVILMVLSWISILVAPYEWLKAWLFGSH
jgi:hypothetical protein